LRQLQQIVLARESFLISGSSGSGKTTLLRAMLMLVPDERILAIEDVAELNLEVPTFVSMQSRNPNVEGRGEINLQTLLTESLRMRPDRIVVGEVRGPELITLLQAINTGHASGATIHANSITEVSKRMLAIAHTAGLGEAALNALVRSSLNWLIHIDCTDAKRRITIRKLIS
jgi:pilus assembly protein CpaF